MNTATEADCSHGEGVMVRSRVAYCGNCKHKRVMPRTWFLSRPSVVIGSCRATMTIGDMTVFIDDTAFHGITYDFTLGEVYIENFSDNWRKLSRDITEAMRQEFLLTHRAATSIVTNVTT